MAMKVAMEFQASKYQQRYNGGKIQGIWKIVNMEAK